MKALMLTAERVPREGYVLSEFEKRTGCPENGNMIFKNPKLILQDIPIPTIGPEEILLRIKACGICGSDVHGYRTDEDGYILMAGRCSLPLVIGHEFSGEIAEVGDEVKELKQGDMVVSEMNLWCGECPACKEGMFNQCFNERELGWTLPGGYEEYVAIEAKYCWKIDSLAKAYGDREKALEAGALVEPTSVAYNAIFVCSGGIRPGDTVVVHGAGPIGLAAIALSKATGAGKIISFEPLAARRALAKKLGADHTFDPGELKKNGSSVHEKIMQLTEDLGAEMHIEATGSLKVYPEIERSLAVGTKLTQIGLAGGSASIHLAPYQFQAARISGSIGSAGHGIWPRVIRLMSSKRVDMTPMITSRFPLERGVEAFKRAAQGREGKILIKP